MYNYVYMYIYIYNGIRSSGRSLPEGAQPVGDSDSTAYLPKHVL